MRSRASGVARPKNMNKTHKRAGIKDKGGCDGFQTCNAGRAGAHPYYATRTGHAGWRGATNH